MTIQQPKIVKKWHLHNTYYVHDNYHMKGSIVSPTQQGGCKNIHKFNSPLFRMSWTAWLFGYTSMSWASNNPLFFFSFSHDKQKKKEEGGHMSALTENG